MKNPQHRVQINILPVGGGDCIHLRFLSSDGKWRNIVVDSGPAGKRKVFRTLLKQISKYGEKIDLMCFSHIDNDHIKGAELTMTSENVVSGLITQICMNIPEGVLPEQSTAGSFVQTGVTEASSLLEKIVNLQIPCKTLTIQGDSVQLGDAVIRVLLPTQRRLDEYYVHLKKIGGFHAVAVSQDRDKVNGSSIALLFEMNSCRILLSGDAFSEDLAEVGEKYAGEKGFSVVKLPHHGSAANISAAMLEKLNTRDFIISTEQNRYRPAAETMELLSEYGGKCGSVNVYGNYEWPRFASGIPNVNIIYPEHGPVVTKEGIEIYADGDSRRGYQDSW